MMVLKPWLNYGSDAVSLNYRWESGDTGSSNNSASQFYCPDWASHARIAYMNETIVWPGQRATFTISFCNLAGLVSTAGYDYREHFALAHGGAWILRDSGDVSKITIDYKIAPVPKFEARIVDQYDETSDDIVEHDIDVPQGMVTKGVWVDFENNNEATMWLAGDVGLAVKKHANQPTHCWANSEFRKVVFGVGLAVVQMEKGT